MQTAGVGLSQRDRPTGTAICMASHAYVVKVGMVKAKFHYTSWFRAGSEQAPNQFRTSSELAPNRFGASSEPASVMEFSFN